MNTQTIAATPPVAATPPFAPLAGFDLDAARQEGWTLAYLGTQPDGEHWVELRSVEPREGGNAGPDQDAWKHVVARARAGSALHQDALARVDWFERLAIEGLCGPW